MAAPETSSASLYAWIVGSGDEAPSVTVYGPAFVNSHVSGVARDGAGNVYVSYSGKDNVIVEFPPHPSGTPTPLRVIEGPDTKLGLIDALAVAPDGTIFASTQPYAAICDYQVAINVYSPNANGDVPPERQLTNPLLGSNVFGNVAVDATDAVFVTVENYLGTLNGAIIAFGPEENGNASPDRTIAGSNTGLLFFPGPIAISPNGRIAVWSSSQTKNGDIEEYNTTDNGNVPPVNTIDFSTLKGAPAAMAFDSTNNLYVSTLDAPGGEMFVYGPNASGSTPPLTSFTPDLMNGAQPPGLSGSFTVVP